MSGHATSDAGPGSSTPFPVDAGPVARRRGRPRSEQVEQAIAEATVELLAEHGVGGLSVEAVAARAGVAKTTIYRRWPGKYELILAVLARARGSLVVPPAGRPVRDDLIFMLERMRASLTDDTLGRILPKLIGDSRDHQDLLDEYLRRIVAPRRRLFEDVLRRGIAEGVIRADIDLPLACEVLLAPVLIGSWAPAGPRVTGQQIPALVDLLLAGLAAT